MLLPVAPIGLVGCLTKALCCEWLGWFVSGDSLVRVGRRADINRTITTALSSSQGGEGAAASVDPRILVLSVSPDQSSTYIPIMNSIFSAQKLVSRPPTYYVFVWFTEVHARRK